MYRRGTSFLSTFKPFWEHHQCPVRSGLLLMPIVVVQALAGVVVGAIIYRYNCIRPNIWKSMVLGTLGFGLYITFGATNPLARLVATEVVAAIGIRAVVQEPPIPYKVLEATADMAIATALFVFVRNLSTTISVVVGGVIFEDSICDRSSDLCAAIGDAALAGNFTAGNDERNRCGNIQSHRHISG